MKTTCKELSRVAGVKEFTTTGSASELKRPIEANKLKLKLKLDGKTHIDQENKKLTNNMIIAFDENHQIRQINETIRDKKYYCIQCNEQLILKKGNIKIHHFSHKKNSNCNGETWQHKYSKILVINNLKKLIFHRKCLSCDKKYEFSFNGKNIYAKEEVIFNDFKLDVGLFENNNLNTAIEIYHTHQTGRDKQQELALNGINYIELPTSEIDTAFEKIWQKVGGNSSQEIERGVNGEEGIPPIKCNDCEVCYECTHIINVKTTINNFKNEHCDLFQNINLNKNIIEINNESTLYAQLYTLFEKNIPANNTIVNAATEECCQLGQNPRKYKIDNECIIAGSFTGYILQNVISNLLKEKSPQWTYNDIDVWIYNENGVKLEDDIMGYNNDGIHDEHVYDLLLEHLRLNYVQTPCAKNITDLLKSFDIPCVQVGYCCSTNLFYMTPFALFAAITKTNLIKFFDPSNCSIYLQYIYNPKIIRNNENYRVDPEQFKQLNGYNLNRPQNPILFNLLDCTNSFNIVQNYKSNLKCPYSKKDQCKALGGQFNYQKKCWEIPSKQSIIDYKVYFNDIGASFFDYETEYNEWINRKKGLLIITIDKPDLFWHLISKIKQTRLYHENQSQNINDNDTKSLLLLSGLKDELFDEFTRELWHDDWGGRCEKFLSAKYESDSFILKIIRKIKRILRNSYRIEKYKERNYTFQNIK